MKRVADAAAPWSSTGAPEGFDALVMADIARARGGLTVFVARDGSRARPSSTAMGFFAPEMEILRFPAWDCLPYDRVGPVGRRRGRADGGADAAGARRLAASSRRCWSPRRRR